MKTAQLQRPKQYLTEAAARKLQPGEVINIGYDDFNKAVHNGCVVVSSEVKPDPYGGDPRLEVIVRSARGVDWVLYSYEGPHRDGSVQPVMCKGSGCERIFLIP